MREPPRLNDGVRSENVFSDSAAGNAGSVSSFPSQPPVKPPSGAWKTVVLAFGATFLAIGLLCGGLVTWLYFAFNAPTEMTAEFRESREPVGGQMQQEVIDLLNSAAPQTSADIESLERFLRALVRSETESIAELVDYPRAVEEMQASGLSVGVNALTKSMWIDNLELSFSVPPLEAYHQIVDFRWLIADKEARVIVVGFSEWGEAANIYLLYLTHKNGAWRLYDHRDPLLPLSEAGYFAAYSAAPLTNSSNYYDLSVELETIYADKEQSEKQRAALTLLSFKRLKYHPLILPMAQNLAAAYLLLYEDIPSLRELTSQFDDATFAGAYRIKAELALLENDPSLAFQHVGRLVASVGWHPSAALIAGRAANTPEERQQAAEWLRRSLVLAPQHTLSVIQFTRVAAGTDYQRLFEDFAGQPNAELMALRFVEQLSDSEEMARVAVLLESDGEFSFAAGYLRFREAQPGLGNEQIQRSLEAAGKLLDHPDLPELRNVLKQLSDNLNVPAVEDNLWNALLAGLEQEATFDLALSAASDQSELTHRLRDRILTWYASTDWPRALRLLEALPTDSALAGEDATTVAIGVCHYRLGEYAAAYQVLLPLIAKNGEEITSLDAPPAYARICLMAAASSAVELGKTLEFAEAMQEPETAFLVLQSYLKLYRHAPDIESLNQWYRQFPDAPRMWLELYEAELSYSKGEWEISDTQLARAIELAGSDERFANADFPPMIASFFPFSEDPSDWFDLRIERALDAGRFADLWNRLTESNEVNKLSGALRWLWGSIDDPATLNEVADLVLTVPTPTAFAINLVGRQHYEERLGNIDAALQLALEGAAAADQDLSYYHSSFPAAVRLMSVHGKFESLDKLIALAKTVDERMSVAVLQAQAAGEADQLLSSLEQYEGSFKLREWFDSIDRVSGLQRAKLFEQVNAKYPVSLSSLAVDYAAAGTIGLAQPASAQGNAIEAALAKATGNQPAPLDLDSFPKASAAWACSSVAGELIAVAYDGPVVEAPPSETLDALRSNYSGLLCLVMQQSPEQPPPTKQLRILAADVSQQLEIASGYYDHKSSQWFSQSGWQADLREAAPHGINRRAPIDTFFPSPYSDPQFANRPDELFVSIGLIVEKVFAKQETSDNREDDREETAIAPLDDWELNSDGQVYELQRPPRLLPLLPPGTRVIE